MTRGRGQLVLLAAVVLAVALVPMTLAYLQLGYSDDTTAVVSDSPVRNADRLLTRTTVDALDGIQGEYDWTARDAAVEAFRDRLSPSLRTLNRSRIQSGTVYRVTYNATTARTWSQSNCPGGPDRQFGPCRTIGGVVVQDRAGRTHVLAAVFDVRVTTPRGEWGATTAIRDR